MLNCAANQVRAGVFCGPKEVCKVFSVAIPSHNANYTHMVINGLLKYTLVGETVVFFSSLWGGFHNRQSLWLHPIIIFLIYCSRWVRAVSCRVAAYETDSIDDCGGGVWVFSGG